MKKTKQRGYASRVGLSVIGGKVFTQKRRKDEKPQITVRWSGTGK